MSVIDTSSSRRVLVVTPIPSEGEAHPNETSGGLLFVRENQHPLGSALDLTLRERYVHPPDESAAGPMA